MISKIKWNVYAILCSQNYKLPNEILMILNWEYGSFNATKNPALKLEKFLRKLFFFGSKNRDNEEP